jgi:hypothetical protein
MSTGFFRFGRLEIAGFSCTFACRTPQKRLRKKSKEKN